MRAIALLLAAFLAVPPAALAAAAPRVVPLRATPLSAGLRSRPALAPVAASARLAPRPAALAPAAARSALPRTSAVAAVAVHAAAPPAAIAAAARPGSPRAESRGPGSAAPSRGAASPARPVLERTAAAPESAAAAFDGVTPPPTRRDESVVDDYFGTKVADPYRWLEDDGSAETKAWVDAQNAATSRFLDPIPERDRIEKWLLELWNHERFGAPSKIGRHWIFSHNSGLQNHDVIYKAKRLYGPRQALLDPNAFSADGTSSLASLSFSRDGRYVAYAVSEAGSDWNTWKVRDVETGKDLPDVIRWTKFTRAAWSPDGTGFYYTRFPEPKPGEEKTSLNRDAKVYYHRLGTGQEQDRLVHERQDRPTWGFYSEVTGDGRYLLLYQYEGTEPKYRVWAKDLRKPDTGFRPVFDAYDANYSIVKTEGDTLYVLTNKDAPRGRLVKVNMKRPQPRHWRTVIPQAEGREVLEAVTKIGNRFVAIWSVDARTEMRVYGPRGGFKYQVKLPGLGTVGGFSPKARSETKMGSFSFSSFNHPSTNFRLNVQTGRYRAFRRPRLPIDPTRFEARQVFYPSKDGTMIPMFIVHKKGLRLDGRNRTYLYGYGGFGVSLTPHFSGVNAAWLEQGGVYAVANLRGGGEYGQEWHDAGRLHKKQNVFDDFIAAAEYLTREGYTSRDYLAIGGGSNGGLLVGAVTTQRPDLFGAAVPAVGVMDMLRFHLFSAGRGWVGEYGSSETEEGFRTLFKYSPLHRIAPGTRYPATLVMTSDHDDRVVPAHSHKYTAALQAAQAGRAPVLTRVEKNAGHGAGRPLRMIAREAADKWAFLLRVLGGR